MMELDVAKKWMYERGYTCNELSVDERKYFTDLHEIYELRMYRGMVCRFTGKIYGIVDLHSDEIVGYLALYITSNRKKIFERYRL